MPPRFGIMSQFGASGNGGDFFEKLYGKIQASVKRMVETSANLEEKYNVIKLLKQTAGLNYSAVIVTETPVSYTHLTLPTSELG